MDGSVTISLQSFKSLELQACELKELTNNISKCYRYENIGQKSDTCKNRDIKKRPTVVCPAVHERFDCEYKDECWPVEMRATVDIDRLVLITETHVREGGFSVEIIKINNSR